MLNFKNSNKTEIQLFSEVPCYHGLQGALLKLFESLGAWYSQICFSYIKTVATDWPLADCVH